MRRTEELAARGLRVLFVAEGAPDESVEDPHRLTALGFVGISDPLRPGVEDAVRRCRQAGVRVVLLTGDHLATARTIAAEAGLASSDADVLGGDGLSAVDDDELGERLEGISVVARITPLDKLRIVQSLQRRGHTVAMTGDGVNDAPALRLADVGVAMGRGGTEVAREAADVVLADDDFSTLVEALVEGRSFWRNVRRALALLLGGNLGELALMAGASAITPERALTTRQVLAVNLVTDVLPAVAVAIQAPEHRDLSALAREGMAALDKPLRAQVLRRAAATSLPAFAVFAASLSGGAQRAQSVAFGGIVSTQLAQTVELGLAEGRLSASVAGAVGVSAAILVALYQLPPLRTFLGLAAPGAGGAALILAASLGAIALSHSLAPVEERLP
jgi:cation-transporting P-type ATPase I